MTNIDAMQKRRNRKERYTAHQLIQMIILQGRHRFE